MKESPQIQKLQQMLRSSKLVAGGFLGTDTRNVTEIIDADRAALDKLGRTTHEIAARMREITETATKALGNWVKIDGMSQACIQEAKGSLVCPWPHPGSCCKRVTTFQLTATGEKMRWSDLNIHLIESHGFFEGKGSAYRLEPSLLAECLFGQSN